MVSGIAMLNLPDSSVISDLLPAAARPIAATVGRWMNPLTIGVKRLLTQPLWFNPVFWAVRHPSVIRMWAKQAYVNHDRVTDDLVAILSRPAYDHNADRALRAMVNSPSGKFTAKMALPHLQIPMLLIWGKQDQMVPPTLAPLFAKLNPAMTVVQLDQAGHCPHDETPERINPLILDWIKTVVT
jgi:pimeloyl-ACP methyl ester carboxylesterase